MISDSCEVVSGDCSDADPTSKLVTPVNTCVVTICVSFIHVNSQEYYTSWLLPIVFQGSSIALEFLIIKRDIHSWNHFNIVIISYRVQQCFLHTLLFGSFHFTYCSQRQQS